MRGNIRRLQKAACMTGCGGTALRKISLKMVAIGMRGSDGVAFDAKSRAMLHESLDVKVHLRESISILTKNWLLVATSISITIKRRMLVSVLLQVISVPTHSRGGIG